jgi:cytoskeletal protein CcmA (bactofilin family)
VLGRSNEKDAPVRQTAAGSTDGSGTSVISNAMRVEGDCATDGHIRVEGHIEGDVVAGTVEIVASGTVGGDVSLGEGVQSSRPFVIGGRVGGAVRAAHVEVGQTGRIDSGVLADEAVIHGHVNGGILARKRLALEASAVVEGDVSAGLLSMKEGARVNGTIRVGTMAATTPARPSRTGRKSAPKSVDAAEESMTAQA